MNEPPVIRKSTVDSPYEPCNDKFVLNQIDIFSFVAVYFNHMVGIWGNPKTSKYTTIMSGKDSQPSVFYLLFNTLIKRK